MSIFKKFAVSALVLAGIVSVNTTVHAANGQAGAKLSLVTPVTGSFEMGKTQSVKWTSTGYTSPNVSVRIIRKVSSNPARYEVVRTISESTSNDGVASWVPSAVESGVSNLSIEIGCKPSAVACQSGVVTGSSIAVTRSARYANTASAFRALEAANNK